MFLKIENRIACRLKVGVHLSSFGTYILHEAGVKIIFKVVKLIKKKKNSENDTIGRCGILPHIYHNCRSSSEK